ncbi:ATP-binding protein [uncultured Lamprocystis sp.]|jgi:predicted AAA+ superfamily ATPase|uniref:ATP-binding protein n=1 Tax=uncultured Lamprocystis sp. TaxID=543132 RepID=UPI0025FDF0CB|nr:ATP-binding protein [uncultured Lamprocystis sp.]
MHGYLPRRAEAALQRALSRAPAAVILGPRQCGKSTLARHILAPLDAVYLDLQDRTDRARLTEPEIFLEHHRAGLVCLDEIQLLPEFFSALRSEIDRDRRPGRFLILGSASRDLIRQANETLAGRIAQLELTPFLLTEVATRTDWKTLWVRGGFPDSLMARDERDSVDWRQDFIRTFLERDIPALGLDLPLPLMERLWRLLAHYQGQTVNYSKLAGVMDLSVPTLKRYLGVLEQTYMVRLLAPFDANLKKRLVRSPKIYLRDSGVLHALLEIVDFDHLLAHPQVGESWEGFVIEQLLAVMPRWRPAFLRTGNGAEVDLVMERGQERLIFEIKLSKAPQPSRGFHTLVAELQADAATVIAPVDTPYEWRRGIWVMDLAAAIDRWGEA